MMGFSVKRWIKKEELEFVSGSSSKSEIFYLFICFRDENDGGVWMYKCTLWWKYPEERMFDRETREGEIG